MPLAVAVASILSSAVNATDFMPTLCPDAKIDISRLLLTSQNRIVPSELPLARIFPSGENVSSLTLPLCPVRVACLRLLATSHRMIVLSLLPLTSIVLSGENTTALTRSLCPLNLAVSMLVAISHNRTVLSSCALATVVLSGDNARTLTPFLDFGSCCEIPENGVFALKVVS